MSDLYHRICEPGTHQGRGHHPGCYEAVEACVHGNYARHMVDRWFRNDTGYNEKWCDGIGSIGNSE